MSLLETYIVEWHGKQMMALETSVRTLASCMSEETQLKSIKYTMGRRWRRKPAGVHLLPVPPLGMPWRPRPRPTPGMVENCRAPLTRAVS